MSLSQRKDPQRPGVIGKSDHPVRDKKGEVIERRESYKIDITIGTSSTAMFPKSAVLYTGAVPNTPTESVIQPNWRGVIRACSTSQSSLSIRDASKNRLIILGQATLLTRIGNLKAHIPYWVSCRLAVDCILGTLFLDRYVTALIPKTSRVILHGRSIIALSSSHVGEYEEKSVNSNPTGESLATRYELQELAR